MRVLTHRKGFWDLAQRTTSKNEIRVVSTKILPQDDSLDSSPEKQNVT